MSEYTEQVEQFLTQHNLNFRAVQSPNQTCPPWEENGSCVHGDRYHITISRKKESRRLRFDFWNSLAAMQKGESVTPYDVLACISSDIYTPESFDGFCAEYGYDEDSRKAEKLFRRADRFARRLREFFTLDEVEALSEIR